MSNLSSQFESSLDGIRDELERARNRYEELNALEQPPEVFVQAIHELEDQLESLERATSVNQSQLEVAQETRERAELLSDALLATQTRQETLIRQQLHRLGWWISALEDTPTPMDSGKIAEEVSMIARQYQILCTLLEKDEYAQIVSNSRFTPPEIEQSLRKVDAKLQEALLAAEYVDGYESGVDTALERIHTVLQDLSSESERVTTYQEALRAVKDQRVHSEELLEADDGSAAVATIREAFEGALMIDTELTRIEADTELARALGAFLTSHDFEAEEEIEEEVVSGDTDDLLARITSVIGAEVDSTISTRVRRLLEETDGSVASAVKRSEMDKQAFLEEISRLYTDGVIADITVEFET
ncbi:hypothetical protein [Halobaculum marinum]|uniref:Uncharacterized protein n=1 Tax=Halobaculum marinum TaxID=3031996 RepID=A0ABD5WWF3_9EURY|nr:hypothetical protein [Halobaculum sp. DT55]